jgi:DNA-binding transcriptional ArsR family regulator
LGAFDEPQGKRAGKVAGEALAAAPPNTLEFTFWCNQMSYTTTVRNSLVEEGGSMRRRRPHRLRGNGWCDDEAHHSVRLGQVLQTARGFRDRLVGRPACEALGLFAAIGHPKRRKILELVAVAGSLGVGAIASHFTESRQAVSKHIAVLEEVELLNVEAVGKERIYTVDMAALDAVREWMDLFDRHWDTKLAALKTFVED